MSLCFRRLYATLPKLPEATTPSIARARSSPLQVRRRRLRKELAAPDGSSSTLSPNEQARYKRLKRLGAFLKEEKGFREPTEEEWISELNEKRTRIRGAVQRVVEDPETGKPTTVEDVVGHRQPYNPWEATFRIPNSVTKLDVRSYLQAVYGIKCTYIRTDNYFAPIWRGKLKSHRKTETRRKSYKRAVVGLVEPFYYPEALEDMELEERQTREQWMEHNFRIKENRDLRQTSQNQAWHGIGWKPFNITGNRGAILRSVIARRDARDRAINQGAQTLLQSTKIATTEV